MIRRCQRPYVLPVHGGRCRLVSFYFNPLLETLRLQHRKEAFHRRIVPTVRLSRHALNHGMLRKQFPIPRRTVQHTLVRMQHRSFISQTGCGFFEHFLHHFAVSIAAHGVGDDFSVEQVQDWREVQFAVAPLSSVTSVSHFSLGFGL